MSEVIENEASLVESMLGGENHSQDESQDLAQEAVKDVGQPTVDVPEWLSDDDNVPFEMPEDSAPIEEVEQKAEKEPEPESPELIAARQEIANLNQRLHDTQHAMHQATEQRSQLQKQLESLKKAQDEESDDWFGEDNDTETTDKPNEELAKVESQLKETDKTMTELEAQRADIDSKAALAVWDVAAAEVKKHHPDFDEVVYDKFAPLIDDQGGDPLVKSLWASQEDKSPAGAYDFAKNLEDKLMAFRDPAGYRQKLLDELKGSSNESRQPKGKQGLDMVNSAVGMGATPYEPRSVIDSILK